MKDHISYITRGTCSRQIEIDIEDGIITDAEFIGGCHGNTQGVCALIRGMKIDDVIERLHGIKCGMKPTSCPDQLSRALIEYKSKK